MALRTAPLACTAFLFAPATLPRPLPHFLPHAQRVCPPRRRAAGVTMEEKLDVLDGRTGAKTGVAKDRSAVHKDGDWHRSMHLWVVKNHSEILLQLRAPNKDTFPGRWDVSCAGHVSAGSTSLLTLGSELSEELGLRIAPLVASGPVTLTPVKSPGAAGVRGSITFAGTQRTSVRGTSKKLGAFECNEFQDVYVLQCEEFEVAGLAFEEGEVDGVRFFPIDEYQRALESGSDAFVPRPPAYREVLFKLARGL